MEKKKTETVITDPVSVSKFARFIQLFLRYEAGKKKKVLYYID
jgi:hypothetical protein